MDYANKEERRAQRAFAAIRDKVFSPVIAVLSKIGVTPNQVSTTGVLFLTATCLLPPSQATPALICMALYVLCDGIDGPLARRMGMDHTGGALVDIVADHVGVVFLSAAAIYHLGAWGPAMVVFVGAYLLFIGLVVYANSRGLTLRRFVRTKYVFFLLYLGSLYAESDLVTYFCGVCGVYYSIEIFEALRRIYIHHDAHRESGPEKDGE
ncbi:MAG: CDP-alcohol phosphatidyltransferase family protein [Desulfovibrionaceae bacterium]|nr:CDP-alcohol phosphatidyltransferase family protein [Desulfovibrionaceae bacterium]